MDEIDFSTVPFTERPFPFHVSFVSRMSTSETIPFVLICEQMDKNKWDFLFLLICLLHKSNKNKRDKSHLIYAQLNSVLSIEIAVYT